MGMTELKKKKQYYGYIRNTYYTTSNFCLGLMKISKSCDKEPELSDNNIISLSNYWCNILYIYYIFTYNKL